MATLKLEPILNPVIAVKAVIPFRENVFTVPWKESDTVLVVQSTEFHLHRSILTLQSPVFKAMLNGRFKEASQDKITLEGKASEDMLQFLKLLYPPNMINEPLISFTGDNVLKMLALADEYQADDVMKQCLEATKITRENAFKIRPYAVKYSESVRKQCNEVINQNIAIEEIEKELPVLDTKVVEELLIAKCHFLESIAVRANDLLQNMLEQILKEKTQTKVDFQLDSDYCCGHRINVANFTDARKCQHCLLAYKKSFIDKAITNEIRYGFRVGGHKPMSIDRTDKLFNTLKHCNDVSTSIENHN